MIACKFANTYLVKLKMIYQLMSYNMSIPQGFKTTVGHVREGFKNPRHGASTDENFPKS